MGILGLSSTAAISDRIFSVMDTRNLNVVTFEEYLGYMDVLINGTDDEKAEQSFSMLASGKEHLDYDDFSNMVASVLTMYNSITGSHFEA